MLLWVSLVLWCRREPLCDWIALYNKRLDWLYVFSPFVSRTIWEKIKLSDVSCVSSNLRRNQRPKALLKTLKQDDRNKVVGEFMRRCHEKCTSDTFKNNVKWHAVFGQNICESVKKFSLSKKCKVKPCHSAAHLQPLIILHVSLALRKQYLIITSF